MHLIEKIRRHGLCRTVRLALAHAARPYHHIRYRSAPVYPEIDAGTHARVLADLRTAGIPVSPLCVDPEELCAFKQSFAFPPDYHGGVTGAYWDEKLLEHFLGYRLGGLDNFDLGHDRYVDVAACSSPWAKLLCEKGYQACAIDLQPSAYYGHLDAYRVMDAKHTRFADGSIRAISLQCAFEMFLHNDDSLFIDECARILAPGGRLVIAPLYMHTHACGFSSPEYYHKGHADPDAAAYIRWGDAGVPFSRNYSAASLRARVLDRADAAGMHYTLHTITNPGELGQGIYARLVLVVNKGEPPPHRSASPARKET